MTESEIFDKFAQIVAKSLRFDASQIPPDILLTDLDAESLDLIEITMETETQFHIFLQDKSILDTAVQAFGPGVLEHDGYLTAEGKQLLLCRMPDADADTFVGQVAAKDFAELFSKSQHLGANAQGLAQYTPAECASCGGNIVPSMG
jgi:acyl carrier protein